MLQPAVNVTAMADLDDQNEEAIVLNSIDDSVIAGTKSVKTMLALEGFRARWTRVGRQTINALDNAFLIRLRKGSQISECRWQNSDSHC